MDYSAAKIYKFPKTIITTKDLALIWQKNDRNNLKAMISYYVKRGVLIRLTRGVFAKDKNYDPRELAVSMYAPSYISFETILREAGFIFQHYDTIFVAGRWSKTIVIDKRIFTFRKLKDFVLYNPTGIVNNGLHSTATPERAFLDTIYLFPDYYFDNLSSLNWELCNEMVGMYENDRLIERLNKYRKNYAQ